jgi:endonuclease III
MATPNRGPRLTKAHKVLKKNYEPVSPVAERSVFEHLLYACCLEDDRYEAADEAFGKLQETYFDWNEVRVTTAAELAEVMAPLHQPEAAAMRLKKLLQSIFETHYSFDLEELKKQNLGKAVKRIEKYDGVTPFVVGYVTQAALGGHAIPVDGAALDLMLILGVITEAEHAKKQVPGLDRAIAKSKGVEFGSLMHQLAADLHITPFGQKPRAIVVEIDPEAKSRLPKRSTKKSSAETRSGEAKTAPRVASKKSKKKTATKTSKPSKKTSTTKKKAAKKSATKKLSRKKPR